MASSAVNFKSNSQIRGLLFLFVLFTLTGCGGLPFPFPGDKEDLKQSCSIAQSFCKEKCEGNNYCFSACSNGFEECNINIQENNPREWEPADAFYDGCKDTCSEDFCSNACYSGQNAAAAGSAEILKKYGTTTL